MMANNDGLIEEELDRRRQWFDWYVDLIENHSVVAEAKEGDFYPCPCCGFKTLGARGGFEMCKVCFWEDDGQDDHDADMVRGGPNGKVSLTQARAKYKAFAAYKEQCLKGVRAPLPEEF